MNIPHTNYDLGFKEAITLFKDKTLDFFGVDELASISKPLATESIQVEIKSLFRDSYAKRLMSCFLILLSSQSFPCYNCHNSKQTKTYIMSLYKQK